ncbi:hypothetical protein MLD38_036762 [Melastoma candidum]|uniref:Uncharacterized protein n=1 Tax=Melastoma candidum TaxID=119954 RepID=A0ACB9LLD8_9MYRT|nr:hypothetical protein MLD38_036762 [Melastoma candidum]
MICNLPPHVIKNFPCLRTLLVVFPFGDQCLGDDDSTLLSWRAHFGSSSPSPKMGGLRAVTVEKDAIPDSLCTKLCKTLTICSLSAASRQQRTLWPIIAEHMTLKSLAVTDTDGQGVLLMDRDQLEERRNEPMRMLPADIRMWEWYAPVVELSCGVVLKGAIVVAILPG